MDFEGVIRNKSFFSRSLIVDVSSKYIKNSYSVLYSIHPYAKIFDIDNQLIGLMASAGKTWYQRYLRKGDIVCFYNDQECARIVKEDFWIKYFRYNNNQLSINEWKRQVGGRKLFFFNNGMEINLEFGGERTFKCSEAALWPCIFLQIFLIEWSIMCN